jgi:hypothetical protein
MPAIKVAASIVEPPPRRFGTGKTNQYVIMKFKKQIDLRAMLKTTHPIVDECCHQTRH